MIAYNGAYCKKLSSSILYMNMNKKLSRVFLLSFLLLLGCFFSTSSLAEEKNNKADATSTEQSPDATEEQKTTLITIYSWATILPKELIDLKNQLSQEETIKQAKENLPSISAEIKEIRWDATIAQTTPDIQSQTVTSIQERVQAIEYRLKKHAAPIDNVIFNLSESRKLWMKKKDEITNVSSSQDMELLLAHDQYQNLIKTIDEALYLIEENIKAVLLIGKAIGDLQIQLYAISSDLKDINIYINEVSTQQTAPSIFEKEFYARINSELIDKSFSRLKYFFTETTDSFKKSKVNIVAGLFAFLSLSCLVWKTNKLTLRNAHWEPFSSQYFSTSILILALVNWLVHSIFLQVLIPEHVENILHVAALFAAVNVAKPFAKEKNKFNLVVTFVIFSILTKMILIVNLPPTVLLLYVFYCSVSLFLYLLIITVKAKNVTVLITVTFAIFPFAIMSLIGTGYDKLAIAIFSKSLTSITLCLVFLICYLFTLGIFELIFQLIPFSLIKNNLTTMVKSLKPLILWSYTLLFIAAQLFSLGFYPTFNKSFSEVYNAGFQLGGLTIQAKLIFTVVLVAYLIFLTSKSIQTVLSSTILPRYTSEKGVHMSIMRLVHYGVLTIGFFILLKFLGFQLNQITLLGGALGVGIGFGLQAIVNNFASGLILLFERPVKVGDTVQIGTDLGEIKQLGLRATIIQTFDNAEIVVPNSDLITGQVTNWTLGNRQTRVKVPVGVAYGTDVNKVLEILILCGQENPMVLNTPAPNALFLAFGPSSLDFELRVWIPEFLNCMQVLSDLNQDIENEFALNNIEIPFPQSDIHVKSVSKHVKEIINNDPPNGNSEASPVISAT